jgi:hypothetical protein
MWLWGAGVPLLIQRRSVATESRGAQLVLLPEDGKLFQVPQSKEV